MPHGRSPHDGQIVGGLYGVTLGRAFFGESMFTRKRDASKVCLAYLVQHLVKQGFVLLDTQFTTPHLERFGAVEVPRKNTRNCWKTRWMESHASK